MYNNYNTNLPLYDLPLSIHVHLRILTYNILISDIIRESPFSPISLMNIILTVQVYKIASKNYRKRATKENYSFMLYYYM